MQSGFIIPGIQDQQFQPKVPLKKPVSKNSGEFGSMVENLVREIRKNQDNLNDSPKIQHTAENTSKSSQNVNKTTAEDISEKNPQDEISLKNEKKSVKLEKTVSSSENEIPVYDSVYAVVPEVSVSQIEYLKDFEKTDDLDLLIENASEYSSVRSKDEILDTIQTFSVDEPLEFLKVAAVSVENQEAVNIDSKSIKNISEQIKGKEESSPFTLFVNDNNGEAKTFDEFVAFELNNRSDEVKSLDPSPVFEIKDERTEQGFENDLKKIKAEEGLSGESKNVLNMTLAVNESVKENILSSNSQTAASSSSTFQQMLNNQIQTNVPDFVKAGSILLRDNNNGVINMNLRPESLGNVKLTLNISDKVITGQIVVQSKEAYEAFRQNLDSLKQAFQESGFENANLTLAYSDSSSGFAQNGRQQQQTSEPFYAKKSYGDYAPAAEEIESHSAVENYNSFNSGRIDIVA